MLRGSLYRMASATSRRLSHSSAIAADSGAQKLLSHRFPVAQDLLSPAQLHRLRATLAPFLPGTNAAAPPPLSFEQQQRQVEVLPPGHHLVFFNDALPETDLDPDGYDGVRSPRGRWSRRMWAGGSVACRPSVSPQLEAGRRAYCHEVVESVEIKSLPTGSGSGGGGGDGSQDKMFVWFKRKMWAGGRYGDEVGRQEADGGRGDGECPVIERRCLVYMPERSKDEPVVPPRVVKAPHKASFSHTFTPTSTLLFRYSALTFNAHKIHFDPSFARDVESHPDVIVHGPLMLSFLLDFLRINVLETPPGNGDDARMVLDSFEYRNLAPVYVDRPCRLNGREISSGASKNDGGAKVYELWAETSDGGYAVKGTAVVKPVPAGAPKL